MMFCIEVVTGHIPIPWASVGYPTEWKHIFINIVVLV